MYMNHSFYVGNLVVKILSVKQWDDHYARPPIISILHVPNGFKFLAEAQTQFLERHQIQLSCL